MNELTRKRWDEVDETDVLIAGADPVGLALALDLDRRGVRCLVLEQGDGQVLTPEVNPIGPRSMELFRRWGVAEKIRCAEFPGARPPGIAWVTQVGGHEIHRFERFTHDTRTPEPEQICPADWLLPVLLTAVGTHPRRRDPVPAPARRPHPGRHGCHGSRKQAGER